MGIRGEVFSTKMVCDGRTYFFNVKENRMGDLFLAIVESKPTDTSDTFERRSIVVFKENLQEFLKSFEKSLDAMDKAQAAKPPVHRRPKRPDDIDDRSRHEPARHEHRSGDGRPTGNGNFSLLPDARGDQPRRKVLRAGPRKTKDTVAPPAKTANPPKKPAGKRLTVKKAQSKKDD
ncbi:MAG: DUF3276 family protein [Spirochaetales bacterium]|nr:MAG: DUF3276 family protein [Spirochaetales bacterium]